MRDYPVLRLMGIVFLILTGGLCPSLLYALMNEPRMVLPFAGTALIGLSFSVYALKSTEYARRMRLSVRGASSSWGRPGSP